MREATPARSAALELADQRKLMRQGYEFLNEKRMLLATEMLRQLRVYQSQSEAFEDRRKSAAAALAAAIDSSPEAIVCRAAFMLLQAAAEIGAHRQPASPRARVSADEATRQGA